MENISGEETARLLRRFGTVRTVPKGTLKRKGSLLAARGHLRPDLRQ